MSKLRADITQKHRVNSDFTISSPLKIVNNIEEENDINDDEEIENIENENLEEEDEDEEIDSANLEEELGNYLQGWAEMLEEETLKFQNEEYEIDELDTFIEINNTTHPAIDSDAKWQLESLFKKLEFPF